MRKYLAPFISMFLLLLAGFSLTSAQDHLPDLALQTETKTHTEIIRNFPHSWKIQVDSDTPIENKSIRIEVLEGVSRNPSLRSSATVDFSSLSSIVRDVTTPDMTEEQKAKALWRFAMNNCYGGRWGTSGDGLEHLNVYGYGYCGTFAAVLEPLWWAAGLTARHVNIGNHAATEVYYDHDWHYLDAHRRESFLEKDNRTIASLKDLNSDLELWSMKRLRRSSIKSRTKYYYMTMHLRGHGRSPIYSRDFTMVKGDQLTLTWEKRGEWCLARGAEGGGKPAPEPPVYANGVFKFSRNFRDRATAQKEILSSDNLDWHDTGSRYLHPAQAKKEAQITYRIEVPYFIPSIVVSGRFYKKNPEDFAEIDLSTDNGKHWSRIWKASGTGIIRARASSSKTQEVTTKIPWKYSYLLRVRMRAEKSPSDVGIFLIQSETHLVYNPKSLPAIRLGANTIAYQDKHDSPRSVRVTYRWQEDLPLRISKKQPMEGEKVTLTALVTNIGTANAHHVPVVFYIEDSKQNRFEIGRYMIKRIRPGETALAKVKWKATRKMGKSYRTTGALVSASVDPDNSINELDESNNTCSRLMEVLHPPEVFVPDKSFIRFRGKKGKPDVITITSTVRNFSSSRGYGIYLDDYADAEGVVVKFFDGKRSNRNQIGPDRVIDCLKPLESQNVSVEWDISKLKGVHEIYVQALPAKNVVRALGNRSPAEAVRSIDLDSYRGCEGKNIDAWLYSGDGEIIISDTKLSGTRHTAQGAR